MENNVKERTGSQENNADADSKIKRKKVLKILLIIISAVLFLMILFFSFIHFKDFGNFSKQIKKDNSAFSVSDLIKECLEKNMMDAECKLIFSSPDISEFCILFEDINLKDDCFYNAGLISYKSDYCEEISNNELKNNCNEELEFEIEVEDEFF